MNNKIEIVLVEDNDDDAVLAIRELTKMNLANKFIRLRDGEEALNYFFEKNIENPKLTDIPKLVLLDLNMPKVGGIEVLKKLKSSEKTQSIPVVIFTSSKEDRDIIEAYKLGVSSYIVKPVDFDKFTKVIEDVGYYWLLVNQNPI